MNQTLILIGAVILIASIFGFFYSDQQQGIVEQAENAASGDQQNWDLIQSLSIAGMALGTIVLLAGAIPSEWNDRREKM